MGKRHADEPTTTSVISCPPLNTDGPESRIGSILYCKEGVPGIGLSHELFSSSVAKLTPNVCSGGVYKGINKTQGDTMYALFKRKK